MSSAGSSASATPRSDETSSARRCGLLAGMEPAIRSVIQRNSAPCAASINARIAMSPRLIRQYRLRYQRRPGPRELADAVPSGDDELDIGCLVAPAPDGENDRRLGGVGFNLLPQALDERVDAAGCDERFVFPHLVEQRIAAEHDAGMGQQDMEQL